MKKIIYTFALISALNIGPYDCLAGKPNRNTYNYDLTKGRTVVYRGQTNNPARRAAEHIRQGKQFTHMRIMGNIKTKAGALKAERRSLETFRKSHFGRNPKYNMTGHG